MKTVVITGASSGVGAAAAHAFARRGYRTILLARSAERLAGLAAGIGPNAHAIPCDVSDPAAVAEAANRIRAEFGTPDILINAAGAGAWKTVPETPPDEAVAMMGAPYFAAYNMTHAFLADMIERGSGHVISLNSPACVVAWRASVAYAAARGALRSFHDALSQDLAGTGVHSSHVIFGRLDTPYFDTNDVAAAGFPRMTRLVRTMSADEAARVLVDVVNLPRTNVTRPPALVPLLAFGRIFPRLARVAARF